MIPRGPHRIQHWVGRNRQHACRVWRIVPKRSDNSSASRDRRGAGGPIDFLSTAPRLIRQLCDVAGDLLGWAKSASYLQAKTSEIPSFFAIPFAV